MYTILLVIVLGHGWLADRGVSSVYSPVTEVITAFISCTFIENSTRVDGGRECCFFSRDKSEGAHRSRERGGVPAM